MNIELHAKNANVNNHFYNKYPENEGYLEIENIDAFVRDAAETIINNYEKPLVKKLISEHYKSLSDEEKNIIFCTVCDCLDSDEYTVNEKLAVIESELKDYFTEFRNINIEGFVSFRLEKYIDILVDIISAVLEEKLAAEERAEFCGVMRGYLEMQVSVYDYLEVIVFKDKFKLLNEDNEDITKEAITSCFSNNVGMFFRADDLLLNLLIITAPKKVVLHKGDVNPHTELYEVLNGIFGSRISVCSGCKLCNTDREVK